MNISDLFTRVEKLTAKEVKKLMEKNEGRKVTLLDVREPAEYEEGHLPGAKFVPLSGLLNNLRALDSADTIITYCRRGPRSKSAAALLKRNGFDDIYYMEGGIDGWNGLVAKGQYDAGLVLLKGRETVEELLSLAWSLEDGTGRFYSKMKEVSGDPEAEGIFASLIEAEEKHKARILDSYRAIKGDTMKEGPLHDMSLEGYIEGGVSVEEIVGWITRNNASLQDILELSMQIETNSLDLYMKIKSEVHDELAGKAFTGLIEEEKNHLSRLGKLLDSVIKSNV